VSAASPALTRFKDPEKRKFPLAGNKEVRQCRRRFFPANGGRPTGVWGDSLLSYEQWEGTRDHAASQRRQALQKNPAPHQIELSGERFWPHAGMEGPMTATSGFQ